jgi:hypothetical protein
MAADLYDVVRALLDPSTADMRVLVAIASGAVLVMVVAVVLILRREPRRPLAELADPAHNPAMDRYEATLRRVLRGGDGATSPDPAALEKIRKRTRGGKR